MPNVAEYVVDRLADLGIDCAFGVPGDYSFPFDDAIDASPRVKWVVCANELNAAYAADGYARIKGAALLSTTYGVGELSALNGVMGARAQRLPVFHIVGAPSTRIQRLGLATHHTLGDNVFNNFAALSEAGACVVARLTPDNVVDEMERVIREAFRLSAPAYITVPMDLGKMPVLGTPPARRTTVADVPRGGSVAGELEAAVDAVLLRLRQAQRVVALPTTFLSTWRLAGACAEFLAKANIPYATTPMDKGVLSEAAPGYLGIYGGQASVPPALKACVEEADVVLDVGGAVMLDFNTSFWTSTIDPQRLVTLGDHFVRVGQHIYAGVSLGDVLRRLTAAIAPLPGPRPELGYPSAPVAGSAQDRITSATFYPRVQAMLAAGDVLVAETGSCLPQLTALKLPAGVGFQNQTLWGSIGWATPATFGVAMAQHGGRTILVTGDGSHQLTANEIGVMGRYGVKPIIFVLNNGIFGVEDVLSELGHVYDDLARWNYHLLPAAMGCDQWFAAKVATLGELDAAIRKASGFDGASYIEVMIPEEESQPLPKPVREIVYKSETPVAGGVQ
ncbi:MAG: thiamine pyrophosphate-binding protein [Burkholderiales bacterium]